MIPTACPWGGALGCSDGARIWSAPTGGPELAVFRVRHEMAHVQDKRRLDDGERNKLKRLMGFPLTAVWSVATYPEPTDPHEKFADAFATCSLGLSPDRGYWIDTGYEWDPSPRQQRLVCGTIWRALAD